MGLNTTPSSERIHIGIFGKRNAGKSSLVNAITGQELSIVSEVLGTTTDPVKKAMEILPLGPVVFIDTPGLDDEGKLGEERVKKANEVLHQIQIGLLVVSMEDEIDATEEELMRQMKEIKVPYIVVMNKADGKDDDEIEKKKQEIIDCLQIEKKLIYVVSAAQKQGIWELKEAIAKIVPSEDITLKLVGDLVEVNDVVVLVVPIDSAAPKGRLILPQQQVIRDILEAGGIPMVCRESELASALAVAGKKPKMVITDSQAFAYVSKVTPKDIPLTSFSILMARYKGDLKTQIEGARFIEQLKDHSKVLISEGCTHHRQCDDIGTVKMPRWIKEYTKKEIEFSFTSGGEFPDDLSEYDLVVHCGGCTLNPKEMRYRIQKGKNQGVPITNYGVMIAYIHGILDRVIEPFAEELRCH